MNFRALEAPELTAPVPVDVVVMLLTRSDCFVDEEEEWKKDRRDDSIGLKCDVRVPRLKALKSTTCSTSSSRIGFTFILLGCKSGWNSCQAFRMVWTTINHPYLVI